MKVLVIGGSGLIGGDAALHLKAQGHDVTIMSRKRPGAPVLAELPFVAGDYINDDLGDGRLAGYDALVFSAAADIRNVPMDGSKTPEEVYRQANDIAVPRAIEAARDAGIGSVVYIGTFYPQVAAHRIGECPYVTSRYNTDRAVRALSSDSFRVCTLDLPFVLGHIPGTEVPHIAALVNYAAGNIPDMPVFAPKGGTNHITSHSVAQAVLGALENGESGQAYLIGDENLSWKDYLERWFAAAGNPTELEVRDDIDHPLLPNAIMFAGAGATVSYDTDPAVRERLGNFDQGRIDGMIAEIVAAYR
ncbi:NAD-dependent epimerase/dehydratase family protein [Parahaliea mediterranea]|uniref:NAD-dependent epimerase/dehydratase family protein n=1 Tax=Parahaliea mediterranea TaxID=651086 RepID=A0A939DHV6_9GAMM|nr:NAD-dependent epimerase/dehydratase family protein [Parahaliea mediterranea]MBN7798620.1 NAD-dependent epimerase/dehydratase family protein [Parahaliea mediterranea]